MRELLSPFSVSVGYMLKVLKSKTDIEHFNEEFKMIRHGNYFDFISSIKGDVPYTVVYKNGEIKSDNISREDDIDFLGLINANDSLRKFFYLCFEKYGDIEDKDIPNELYETTALFEISIRMHANNNQLVQPHETLNNTIDSLGAFKKLTPEQLQTLHNGRKFINMIKHGKKSFSSWEEGNRAIVEAYSLLKVKKLTII